ncbi:hypothetical protein Taro_010551 [Colocasia esculenta]|uniref:Uncharacterized protein n=1 Tax=Colocasia esculenta TaxID=4460 RepID=A0A843U3D9_COLES|nr:hypothetical protein [Colocasia esculenta]
MTSPREPLLEKSHSKGKGDLAWPPSSFFPPVGGRATSAAAACKQQQRRSGSSSAAARQPGHRRHISSSSGGSEQGGVAAAAAGARREAKAAAACASSKSGEWRGASGGLPCRRQGPDQPATAAGASHSFASSPCYCGGRVRKGDPELDQVYDIGGDYLELKILEIQLVVLQAEIAITSTRIVQAMN